MSETSDERPWPPETLKLQLRKPLELAGEAVTSLSLREPTAGEWAQIEAKPAHEQRAFAIHLIAELPLQLANKVSIGDAVLAEDYLASFFEIARAMPVWSKPSSPGSTAGTPSSSDD
jgi:hypothetical protein